MKEIERKYLVRDDSWKGLVDRTIVIRQGYLSPLDVKAGKSTTRVRVTEEKGKKKAYMTVKENKTGISRSEFEHELPVEQAESMLASLAEGAILEKIRHTVNLDSGHVVEVDEFKELNDGLVLAEIELKFASERVALPAFLGNEVSHLDKYFNLSLVKRPYSSWGDSEDSRPLSRRDIGKHFWLREGGIVRLNNLRVNDRDEVQCFWSVTQGEKVEFQTCQNNPYMEDSTNKLIDLDFELTNYLLATEETLRRGADGKYVEVTSGRTVSTANLFFADGKVAAFKVTGISQEYDEVVSPNILSALYGFKEKVFPLNSVQVNSGLKRRVEAVIKELEELNEFQNKGFRD